MVLTESESVRMASSLKPSRFELALHVVDQQRNEEYLVLEVMRQYPKKAAAK